MLRACPDLASRIFEICSARTVMHDFLNHWCRPSWLLNEIFSTARGAISWKNGKVPSMKTLLNFTLECGNSMRTFGGLPDPLQMLRTVLICPLCPFPRICFELVGWPVFQKELQQECFLYKVVRQGLQWTWSWPVSQLQEWSHGEMVWKFEPWSGP